MLFYHTILKLILDFRLLFGYSTAVEKLTINTYTDESGQDTQGKIFIVCTIIIPSDKESHLESNLKAIEIKSRKTKKWYESGNKKRNAYVKLILEDQLLTNLEIFCSIYENKKDYITLTSAHIAKAILSCTKDKKYIAKIFIDKMDKATINLLRHDIKLFHIRYKKIRGLSDAGSRLIRLADAICGLMRDLDKKKIPKNYNKLASRIQKI